MPHRKAFDYGQECEIVCDPKGKGYRLVFKSWSFPYSPEELVGRFERGELEPANEEAKEFLHSAAILLQLKKGL